MGWWGTGIMEGDTPEDAGLLITEFLMKDHEGCDLNEPDVRIMAQAKLKQPAELDALIAVMPFSQLGDSAEGTCWQTLAFLCICEGAPIDKFKDKVVDAITEELKDLSDWNEPEDRRASLQHFLDTVNAYDGQAVDLWEWQYGVMEKITAREMAASRERALKEAAKPFAVAVDSNGTIYTPIVSDEQVLVVLEAAVQRVKQRNGW